MSIAESSDFQQFIDLETQVHADNGISKTMLTKFYTEPDLLTYVFHAERGRADRYRWEELDHSKAYWQSVNRRNTLSSLKSNAETAGIPYFLVYSMGNESASFPSSQLME
jgi:hypothetical protein